MMMEARGGGSRPSSGYSQRSRASSVGSLAASGGGGGSRLSRAGGSLLTRYGSRPDLYNSIRHDPTNRALVLDACPKDRYALLHATKTLKGDREIVRSAVRHCGDSLLLSSLHGDREVVNEAVSGLGDSLRYAEKLFRGDREIVLSAVTQDGLALRYATDKLKDDKEVVLKAVRQTGRALRHASKRLQGDLEVVMEALSKDNTALAYVAAESHESVYGVGQDGRVYYQALETLSTASEWELQSKPGVSSITVFGPRMYAVGTDGYIYKQMMVTMNPESTWTGPLTGGEVEMLSIAIGGGFVYGVAKHDKRVYKQVLTRMSPSSTWDGPISDETEITSILINEDQMYGVGADAKLYQQNYFTMCNTSEWKGPLTTTMDVKGVSMYGNKIFTLSLDNKVHWQLLVDFNPYTDWRLASQGDTIAVAVCATVLKEACQDMLEDEWRVKGYHIERRMAAENARGPGG